MVAVDLDGVLADFRAGFHEICGVSHKTLTDDQMWKEIDRHLDFFERLPPLPAARAFFEEIAALCASGLGITPVILTACPAATTELFQRSVYSKRRWVTRHIGAHVPVLTSVYDTSKASYMTATQSILIDDWSGNTNAWEAAGGRSILHRSNGTTIATLKILIERSS